MRRNLLLTRLIGFPQINYARDCTLNFFTLRNQEHQRHFLVSVSSVHDYSPRLSQVCTCDHHLRETHSGKERVKQNRVFALLDTGSLPGNFIASSVVEELNLNEHIIRSKKLCSVFSGLDNHCHDISDIIELTLPYFCLDLNKLFSFRISAYVLKQTPIDPIIGRKTICFATNLGTFLAMSFRLALLLSLSSKSTLMTNYGKSHVIVLLLDPNRLQIKLTLYVNSRSLKCRGSSKNQMRLITAKSSWFLNLLKVNASNVHRFSQFE
jgi:hypothetical protein